MRFLEARSSGVKASPAQRIVSMLEVSQPAKKEFVTSDRHLP